MRRLLRWYKLLSKAYPMRSSAVQTCFLSTAGDITAQELIERRGKEFDPYRAGRMALIGIMLGPAITLWYRGLDCMFGAEMSTKAAIAKVLFIEIVMSPPAFFGILMVDALLEKKPPLAVLQEKFLNMLLANYIYWPTASFMVFRLVPPHGRVFWTSVLGFGWNVCMSLIINNECCSDNLPEPPPGRVTIPPPRDKCRTTTAE